MKKYLVLSVILIILGGCGSKSDVKETTEISSSSQEKTAQSSKSKESRKRRRAANKTATSQSTTESTTVTTEEKKATEISTKVFLDPDEEQEVGYFSEGDSFGAIVPDFKNYSKKDALVVLGEPTKYVTDANEIIQRLALEGSEFDRIKAEFKANKLTESQAKAFMFQATDIRLVAEMGSEVVALIYDEKEKPNVYLLNGQVAYVTPISEYMEFNGKLTVD